MDYEEWFEDRTLQWKYDTRWERDGDSSDSNSSSSSEEDSDSDLDSDWEYEPPIVPVREPANDARKARDDARKRLEDPEFLAKMIEKCPERIGDVFEVAPEGSLIIQAVNCRGVWGTGFAAQLSHEKANAAYRHHFVSFKGKGYTAMEEQEQKALAGTATIIPPHPKDEHKWWIACLFTSYSYGLGKDPANVILENTKNALQDLKSQLEELSGDKEISKFQDKIYSVRFNDGFFRVPWERTVCLLIEADLPKVNVYTDPYCMKDADRIRFFAYMEKTGQDPKNVAVSKQHYHNLAMFKVVEGFEPYKPDRGRQEERWFDSDGESIHQSEDELGSIDILKPAKMRMKEFDKVEQFKLLYIRARRQKLKRKRDQAKVAQEEVARLYKIHNGEIPRAEVFQEVEELLKSLISTSQTPQRKTIAAKPESKSLVKAGPKKPAQKGKAGQSSATTPKARKAAKASSLSPSPKTVAIAKTPKTGKVGETTGLTPSIKRVKVANTLKTEKAEHASDLTPSMNRVEIANTPKTEKVENYSAQTPSKNKAVAVTEEGSPVRRTSTRSAAARTTKRLKNIIDEPDSDADDANVDDDGSDIYDPDK